VHRLQRAKSLSARPRAWMLAQCSLTAGECFLRNLSSERSETLSAYFLSLQLGLAAQMNATVFSCLRAAVCVAVSASDVPQAHYWRARMIRPFRQIQKFR
jgi:hypothetical protein